MAGRIRTVKPEWLEDELLIESSSDARVLSVALIVLADDYGNGRASDSYLLSRAFPGQQKKVLQEALARLVKIRFCALYDLDGQRYFSIRNWAKHQRVDKPGKPLVPPSPNSTVPVPAETHERDADMVYFAQHGDGGPIKIGRSWNPEDRIRKFGTGSPGDVTLLGVIDGGWKERELHKQFAHLRISEGKEWFTAGPDLTTFIRANSRAVRESPETDPESGEKESDPDAPRARPIPSLPDPSPIQSSDAGARDDAPTGPPPPDRFGASFGRNPPGKRDDVLRVWEAFKRSLGLPPRSKLGLGRPWDPDAQHIADAIDAYDEDTCVAVATEAPRDGMVNGSDDKGVRHATVRYVFENQDTFKRIFRSAEDKKRRNSGIDVLTRAAAAEPDLSNYRDPEVARCPQQ